MLGQLSTFVSKKLGVVIALATMVSQVAEVSPEIALAKIGAYALLGIGYVLSQALVDSADSKAVMTEVGSIVRSESQGGE